MNGYVLCTQYIRYIDYIPNDSIYNMYSDPFFCPFLCQHKERKQKEINIGFFNNKMVTRDIPGMLSRDAMHRQFDRNFSLSIFHLVVNQVNSAIPSGHW